MLGAAQLTGGAWVGIVGGFTTIEASLVTVGVNPMPPGVVGGAGVLGRTLPPPPPQAANASAIAQGNKAQASSRLLGEIPSFEGMSLEVMSLSCIAHATRGRPHARMPTLYAMPVRQATGRAELAASMPQRSTEWGIAP